MPFMLDIFEKFDYNKCVRQTDRRLALIKKSKKELDRLLGGSAVYFFLLIMATTNEMIDTIKLPNRNKSLYVTIITAPFRGLTLTAYRLRSTLHEYIISAFADFCNRASFYYLYEKPTDSD